MRTIAIVTGAFVAAAAVAVGPACRPEGRLSTRRYEYPPAPRSARRAGGPRMHWLAPAEARRELKTDPNVFLICVATKEQYDRGHLPGSLLIPVMGLRAALEKNDFYPEINRGRTPRKDQRIICYCWWRPCICPSVPTYSELAGKILLKAGYKNVALLDGGMRAWIEADLPVQRPAKRNTP